MNKILTVSIAAYNVEETLEQALNSLLQDESVVSKLEIIIENDGSKDKTQEIAENYMKKYPNSVIVNNKQNGGYGSTINESIEIANGKYFKQLDGDDWFEVRSLASFVDYLEKCSSDLVISPYSEVRTNETIIDNHKDIPEKETNINDININNKLVAMHEISIKTKLLKESKLRLSEKCFYTDSEYVFCCLLIANTVSRFSEVVYKYRLGVEGQSVSLDGIRKHQPDLTTVAMYIFDCFTKNMKNSGNKQELLFFCVKNITFQCYRSFLLLEKPAEKKDELKQLDKKIEKEYPRAYEIGNQSKLVSVLRKMRFEGISIIAVLVKHKYINELK